MKKYDYIIAGGGCAGMSLLYQISISPILSDSSILVIDRDDKNTNDRTWCFWTDKSTPFDSIVSKEWKHVAFKNGNHTRVQELTNSAYKTIHGIDFYTFVKDHIATFPNIDWLKADVSSIGEDEQGPVVYADGKAWRATYVFDSIFTHEMLKSDSPNHHFLYQHFKGYKICTEQPVFDEGQMTLMDFGIPQKGNARFFYVLPYSKHSALVEYTIFSGEILPQQEYDEAIQAYIKNKLQISEYTLEDTEFGVIPMSDHPLPTPKGAGIIPIGTRGGAVKPTTGYAFLRIQEQVTKIVGRLESGVSPAVEAPLRKRFRFYDTLLLHILQNDGRIAHKIFSRLFFNNRLRTILTFLDERTTILQEGRIFASLPFKPFLNAVWETKIFNKFSKTLLPEKSVQIKRT